MNYRQLILLSSIIFNLETYAQTQYIDSKKFVNKFDKNSTIEIQISNITSTDSLNLEVTPLNNMVPPRIWTSLKQKPEDGTAVWKIPAKDLYYIYFGNLFQRQKIFVIAEPGDKIAISVGGTNLTFTGRGSAKYQLQYRIEMALRENKLPIDYINRTSLAYFLDWNNKFNKLTEQILIMVSMYEENLSPAICEAIKAYAINRIEENRLDIFWALRASANKGNIAPKSLSTIFDTCFYSPPAVWMRSLENGIISGSHAFIRAEVFRQFGFDNHQEEIQSQTKRRFLYYNQAKKTYKGLALQKYYLDLMTSQTMKELGFTPETEQLLNTYYSEPGHLEYKEYVKNYEKKTRALRKNSDAPEFTLTDINGRLFKKEMLKGKVTLMDFWFTGCMGCIQLTPSLKKVEQVFRHSKDVQFISISIDSDKNKWLESIRSKKYMTDNAINLYTGGQGADHVMLKSYNVSSYPSIFLLNANGKIAENPLPDPRDDNGEKLVGLISKEVAKIKDGPYVFYVKDSIKIYSIDGSSVVDNSLDYKNKGLLEMQGVNFLEKIEFKLKKKLKPEPSEFGHAKRLFVLSDIEGNLDALLKLLMNNNIIDHNFNWTWGQGHLIFGGDIFDRGEQVTECLWLIYALEEKAKAAGGYVHFILGNHEIMNLSGDIAYVKDKYRVNAQRLNRIYSDLYNTNTELGRWLRTKNIMEKIGDILFVHGGISQEVNDLSLSIKQINNLARKYYDKAMVAANSSERNVAILYNTANKLSPFWYRNYYLDQERRFKYDNIKGRLDTVYKATDQLIEEVLTRFDVKRIVTGHTIVSDTISLHYQGKVINTDTRHAYGRSEALLIEYDNFYRTDAEGKRNLLLLRNKDASASKRVSTKD